MIIPLNLELHVSDRLTDDQRAEVIARASDSEALGTDFDLPKGATFAEALAHLVMFDPTWLFSQRWLALGWVADDPNA